MNSSHLIVLGGGVIGLSIAWEARRRGLRVTLLERNRIGGGASWTAAGILPPANPATSIDPIDQLRGLSHQLHPRWAAELHSATGIETGLRRCGGLYLATSPGEAAALLGLNAYWQAYEIKAERLTDAELLRLEPNLQSIIQSHTIRAAVRLEDEYQLRCPDHLKALRTACELSGVDVRESVTVEQFREVTTAAGSHVEVTTAGPTFESQFAVVTAGAWSAELAAASEVAFQVIPVRGQMLLYRLPSAPFRHVINEGNRYFVARDDGHVLVGSCEEEVGFCEQTTPAALASFRVWAEGFLPELKHCPPVQSWAGLRPQTIDGFPYIGRVPQTTGLFVATGHYRSGIHLSCGTAVVMADLLTGIPPAMDLDPFRVGRG